MGVISNKGAPPLASGPVVAPAGPRGHVATDGARRDPNPEHHEQFRGDPRLTPRQIAPRHCGDQALEIRREAWAPGPRSPAPEESESVPVSAKERRRLHDRERLAPGETAREEDEREPERVRGSSWLDLALAVHGQLFSKEDILGGLRGAAPEAGAPELHEVHPESGHHPDKVKKRRNMSYDDADSPASDWVSLQCLCVQPGRRGGLPVRNA